jgi:hypothetical protein
LPGDRKRTADFAAIKNNKSRHAGKREYRAEKIGRRDQRQEMRRVEALLHALEAGGNHPLSRGRRLRFHRHFRLAASMHAADQL